MISSGRFYTCKYNVGSTQSQNNFSFAENTTYGCGGYARVAYFPESIPQAKQAYDLASKGKFTILGNGSNVLASDNFFDGAVISTKRLTAIYQAGEYTLCCLSGTTISQLLRYCRAYNFSGLEYMCGIPATVGGAAFMNAGACGRYIGDDILKVRVYDKTQRDLSNKDCNFGYKHSTMCDINALILSVYVKIKPNSDEQTIENAIKSTLSKRKGLPSGHSCGCVFKNIGGLSAGKIIQVCGLGGITFGGAAVSKKHCNFIINNGGSSADVRRLIEYVKREVYRRTGYTLEEEVIYIGESNDFNS